MSGSARIPNILVIGTGDTKSEELLFMADVIGKSGGLPVMVDVSVLSDPPYMADYSRLDIAAAGKRISDAFFGADREQRSVSPMRRSIG